MSGLAGVVWGRVRGLGTHKGCPYGGAGGCRDGRGMGTHKGYPYRGTDGCRDGRGMGTHKGHPYGERVVAGTGGEWVPTRGTPTGERAGDEDERLVPGAGGDAGDVGFDVDDGGAVG